MTDLGTVNGEPCSTAQGINSKRQVVGISFNCIAGGYAWLWENGGPIVDLNTLVLPESNLALQVAENINDRGEIAGLGVPPGVPVRNADGLGHAFLLIPVDEDENEEDIQINENPRGRFSRLPVAIRKHD